MSEEVKPETMTFGELEFYFDSLPNLKADIRSSPTDMKGIEMALAQLGKDWAVCEYGMADVIKWVEQTRRA